MEDFIHCLMQYLVPQIDSGRWQLMWNICNLLCGVVSTALVYTLYYHWYEKKFPTDQHPFNLKKKLGLIALSVFSLYILGLASEFLQRPDVEFPLYDLLYPITDFLDQFLNLRELRTAPVASLPLANMSIRICLIFALCYVSKGIFGVAQGLAAHFGNYLDERFKSTKIESFAGKVWNFLKKTGLLGAAGLGTAAVVTKDTYRDKVLETLDWLYDTLSQITLLSHLPENAATIPEIAESFFVVILSILIVASYLLLIVAVSAVARILWDKREDIQKHITKWFKEVGYILLILALVLFVVLFSVLFATENASFQEAITHFIQDSPRTIFVLLQHTVMLLAAVGVVVLMCTSLIAVVMFGINLVIAWGKDIKVDKMDANSAKTFLKRFASTFLAGLVFLLFIFGYDPVRGWLVERFANDAGHGLWWVVGQICSGIAAIIALLIVVALAVYCTSVIWRGIISLNWSKNKTTPRQKPRIPLGQQIEDYLSSLLQTFFRIFKGYQTEDQKNAAIYVAACFASLASLVNTAVGLHDFNIGWFLAIAMSFAVQLAMLIFGMKAGQGIAENIVTDVRQVGASIWLAIARKIAAALFYWLGFLAVQYGISIFAKSPDVLGLSLGSSAQSPYFLPVLLIRCAILFFGYGIIKQILDVISLLFRRKNARKNHGSHTDPDDGLILGNPRRIPARYPLIAYLLFMIVSTGFAFTNLFGGYANQVQLHTRVYDQVYSETEKQLVLQDTAVTVVDNFLDKKQTVLNTLRTSYNELVKTNEDNQTKLKAAMDLESTHGKAHNEYQFYVNQMADFPAFYESLVSIINREYDRLGEDMTIQVFEYSYYLYGSFRYRTVAFEINPSGSMEKLTIGKLMNDFDSNNRIETKVTNSDTNQETVTAYWQRQTRTVKGANKYVLLSELLSVYENYAKAITQDVTGNINTQLQTITEGLYDMERLDGVRRNVAELYFASDPDAEQCVSMVDLPRVIDLYLMQEKAVQPEQNDPAETVAPTETAVPTEPGDPGDSGKPDEPAGTDEPTETTIPAETSAPTESKEQKYDKLAAYQDLSDYVDRAIQIYNILQVAVDNGNSNSVYTVRTYRSYAKGVASSNLQISLDALTKGTMGMNGTGNDINALYSAQMVAIFILIICALVDFMAFFSGLLLFQDIFLLEMKRESKLSKLGYIAFDAILTKYLMPPERDGNHRTQKTALIYYLLYCQYSKTKNDQLDKTHVDTNLLDKLKVEPEAFKVLLYRTLEYLEKNSVSIDTPEFHGWLDSFVKKNGINFDDVLK